MRRVCAIPLMGLMALAQAYADEGPTVLARGIYSFQAPPGWIVLSSPSDGVQRCSVMVARGLAPTISVTVLRGAGTAARLADTRAGEHPKDGNRVVGSVSKQPFLTTAGLDGFRVQSTYQKRGDGHPVTKIDFFFQSSDTEIVRVTARCPAENGSLDVPLFDTAMKGFTLE